MVSEQNFCFGGDVSFNTTSAFKLGAKIKGGIIK
jgi:hypothetical protein